MFTSMQKVGRQRRTDEIGQIEWEARTAEPDLRTCPLTPSGPVTETGSTPDRTFPTFSGQRRHRQNFIYLIRAKGHRENFLYLLRAKGHRVQ